MVKAGIALIVLALLALPVAFLSALFGLLAVAVLAKWIYIISPIMLIAGVVLLVVGSRRGASTNRHISR